RAPGLMRRARAGPTALSVGRSLRRDGFRRKLPKHFDDEFIHLHGTGRDATWPTPARPRVVRGVVLLQGSSKQLAALHIVVRVRQTQLEAGFDVECRARQRPSARPTTVKKVAR